MYEELTKNVRRSAFLVTGVILVTLGAGYFLGWAIGGAAGGIGGLLVAGIIATIMSLSSWYAGDRMVLRLHRAREVSPQEEARLHNLVEGLCIAAGIPKPKIYVVEDPSPNAFATGRDPKHASIAVTRGLLDKMNRIELEGVVAHELAHVKNRDTLVMVIVATLVGVLVLLADWTFRSMFWGVGGRRGRGGDGGGPAAAAFLVLGLVAAIFMPLLAKIMQMAVSRRREFYADVTGVQFTRYPPGLINALEKLKADTTVVRTAEHATGHLWIEQPLNVKDSGFGGKMNRLFATHPPLDERIRILREL